MKHQFFPIGKKNNINKFLNINSDTPKPKRPIFIVLLVSISFPFSKLTISPFNFNKIFSFTLTGNSLKAFCDLSEDYLLHKTQRKFKTLEFYRVIED